MGVQIDLSKALDKAYEDKSVTEILDAPPSALAGLTEKHDAALAEALGITTVRQARLEQVLRSRRGPRGPRRQAGLGRLCSSTHRRVNGTNAPSGTSDGALVLPRTGTGTNGCARRP